MLECSIKNCPCREGDPEIGTAHYPYLRRHPDAGDISALKEITRWVKEGIQGCHLRYADGEFRSIQNFPGGNSDDQEYAGNTLGLALRAILEAWRGYDDPKFPLLFGGDWAGESPAFVRYMHEKGFFTKLKWCPNQVFVNGIVSGHALEFYKAVRNRTGNNYLVCNEKVAQAAIGLRAKPIVVPMSNAWNSHSEISEILTSVLRPGDLVIYAAGMLSEVVAINLWNGIPSTHIDVGCALNGAGGLRNRTWLERDDEQTQIYWSQVVPFLLGKD